MLLIVHQCLLMTLSRKIIVFKPTLQTTNKFYFLTEYLDDLKKSIYFDKSFYSKFLVKFHVSAPNVTLLFTIELYINFVFSYLSVAKFTIQQCCCSTS